jgi:hypothetical protein
MGKGGALDVRIANIENGIDFQPDRWKRGNADESGQKWYMEVIATSLRKRFDLASIRLLVGCAAM